MAVKQLKRDHEAGLLLAAKTQKALDVWQEISALKHNPNRTAVVARREPMGAPRRAINDRMGDDWHAGDEESRVANGRFGNEYDRDYGMTRAGTGVQPRVRHTTHDDDEMPAWMDADWVPNDIPRASVMHQNEWVHESDPDIYYHQTSGAGRRTRAARPTARRHRARPLEEVVEIDEVPTAASSLYY